MVAAQKRPLRWLIEATSSLMLLMTVLVASMASMASSITTAATICTQPLPQAQYQALVDLYYATNGPNWCLYQWPVRKGQSTSSPCLKNWTGVTCGCITNGTATQYAVIGLSLQQMCISGTIPETIGNLTSLGQLSISDSDLYGPIPSTISKLSTIFQLDLSQNALTGPLPESLFTLTNLFSLTLDDNWLRGSLSPQIGNLTSLFMLSISHNNLTSSIPPELAKLTGLGILELGSNDLTGPIPAGLSNLRQLIELDVSGNLLNGTIPASLGTLTQLQSLDLAYNLLEGQVPTALSTLKHTLSIYLNNNFLTSSLPTQLSALTGSNTLDLSNNLFTGSFPTFLTSLKSLENIDISSNHFHGSLPDIAYSYTSCFSFAISDNFFTGTMPQSFENNNCYEFDLSDNYFDGSFPWMFYNPSIFSLDLSQNYFTGSLTVSVALMSYMFELTLASNFFTHTIPTSISSMESIMSIDFSENLFSGSIPATITDLSGLNSLYINDNKFSGSLPPNFARDIIYLFLSSNQLSGSLSSSMFSRNTTQLLLNNNKFTGNLTELFSQRFPNLQAINVGSNLFTGPLPSFSTSNVPLLVALAAVDSCFSGTLPSSLCSLGATLTTLTLDGLGSNMNCPKNRVLNRRRPDFVNAVYQQRFMDGDIPGCLFQMDNLVTLHLAGNGFQGTIGSLSVNSSLQDLSLSCNRLTGTIPLSLQDHSFQKLDLRSNKLDGDLAPTFVLSPSQTTLTLAVNRISGLLPHAIYAGGPNITDMDVLVSNVFSCDTPLPSQDSYFGSYYCGSSQLSYSSYTWLVFAALVGVLFLYVNLGAKGKLPTCSRTPPATEESDPSEQKEKKDQSQSQSQKRVKPLQEKFADMLKKVKIWWSIAYGLILVDSSWREMASRLEVSVDGLSMTSLIAELIETKLFLISQRISISFSLLILGLISLVVVPVYVAFHFHYSIVSHDYGYILSMAYLHGWQPVVFLGLFVSMVLLITSGVFRFFYFRFAEILACVTPMIAPLKKILTTEEKREALFRVKKYSLIFLVHTVNLVITVAVNAAYVNSIVSNQSLNRLILVFIQIFVAGFKLVWNNIYIPYTTLRVLSNYMSHSRAMQNRLAMSIVNYILAPCIATLISNQSCFYFAAFSQSPITTQANISVCDYFVLDSATQKLQCAASMPTLFSTTFTPPFFYSYQCGAALIVTYTPVLIYSYIMSGVVAPVVRLWIGLTRVLSQAVTLLKSLVFIEHKNDEKTFVRDTMKKEVIRIRGSGLTVTLLLHFTVLFTFGIASPILAVAIVVTLVNDSLIWILFTGRYLCMTSVIKSISYELEDLTPNFARETVCHKAILEEDVRFAWQGFDSCYMMVAVTTSSFWALLFFDMIADRHGIFSGMLTSLLFGLLLPVFLAVRRALSHKTLVNFVMNPWEKVLFQNFRHNCGDVSQLYNPISVSNPLTGNNPPGGL